MADNQRVHLVVTGRVQGVGFRYSTVLEAQSLGLTGTVRNRYDGGVEVVAEGSPEALGKLVLFCHRGPALARVENVDVQWQGATHDFATFDVVR